MSTPNPAITVQTWAPRPVYRLIIQRLDEDNNVVREYSTEGMDKTATYTYEELGRLIANTIEQDQNKLHVLPLVGEDSE